MSVIKRWSVATVATLLAAHGLPAQGPFLPPVGGDSTLIQPSVPGDPTHSAPAGLPSLQSDEVEVYNRGPVHEAFATPSPNDPSTPPVVLKQPPEPIEELPPTEAPEGVNVTWISGYWAYDETLDDFLWISGLWREIPPGRVWVPGYWTNVANGWQWVNGVWMSDDQAEVNYLPSPPPSQERGPNIEPPGANFFWIPGHWSYATNNYQWTPGYWAPHQSQWIWIPAKYVWTPAGCLFAPGYWDYIVPDRGLCYAPVYFPHHHHRHDHHYPIRFTPSVCLDSWNRLTLHLFVRPNYGHYCFGDYYAPRFANDGYVPFHAFHQHRGYDPLFVHLRYQHGPHYSQQLREWHHYFDVNAQFRPQPTFRQQREFVALHADNPIVQASSIALRADRLQELEAPLRLARISDQRRDQQAQQARQLQAFTQQRLQLEVDGSRTPGRNENPNPGVPRGQSHKLRIVDALKLEQGVAGSAVVDVRPPERPDQLRNIRPDDPEGDPRIPGRGRRVSPDANPLTRDSLPQRQEAPADRSNIGTAPIGPGGGPTYPQPDPNMTRPGRPIVQPSEPDVKPGETVIRQRGNSRTRESIEPSAPDLGAGHPDPRTRGPIEAVPPGTLNSGGQSPLSPSGGQGPMNGSHDSFRRGRGPSDVAPNGGAGGGDNGQFPMNPQQRLPRNDHDLVVPPQGHPVPGINIPRGRTQNPTAVPPGSGSTPGFGPTNEFPGGQGTPNRGRSAGQRTLPNGGAGLAPSLPSGTTEVPPNARSNRSGAAPQPGVPSGPPSERPAPRGRSKEKEKEQGKK